MITTPLSGRCLRFYREVTCPVYTRTACKPREVSWWAVLAALHRRGGRGSHRKSSFAPRSQSHRDAKQGSELGSEADPLPCAGRRQQHLRWLLSVGCGAVPRRGAVTPGRAGGTTFSPACLCCGRQHLPLSGGRESRGRAWSPSVRLSPGFTELWVCRLWGQGHHTSRAHFLLE